MFTLTTTLLMLFDQFYKEIVHNYKVFTHKSLIPMREIKARVGNFRSDGKLCF